MKKTLSILLTLALVAVFAFTLVACGDKGNENGGDKGGNTTPIEYTITFDSKGGSAVAAITASAGEEITAPTNPTKEGFEFLGWFESTDGGETLAEKAFIVNVMPARNVTLYANWTELTEKDKTYSQTEFIIEWESEAAKEAQLEEMEMSEEQFLSFYNGVNMTIVFSADRLSVTAPGYPGGGYSVTNLYYTIAEDGVISVYKTAEEKESGTPYTEDGLFMNTFVISSDYKTIRMIGPMPGTTEMAIVLTVLK